VQSEKLDGKISNLHGTLRDDEGHPFVYSGYVSGEDLDEMVNLERTGFAISDMEDVLGDPT
jgi:hypothetical protein